MQFSSFSSIHLEFVWNTFQSRKFTLRFIPSRAIQSSDDWPKGLLNIKCNFQLEWIAKNTIFQFITHTYGKIYYLFHS